MVDCLGFFVSSETPSISSADTRTMGTTGMKPRTAVPPGVRDRPSAPPMVQTTDGGPGAGAGTTCWKIAMATTAAAVHSVTANAPHFVLPFQNSAATSNGESAAKPEKAYWIANSKIVSGARNATA